LALPESVKIIARKDLCCEQKSDKMTKLFLKRKTPIHSELMKQGEHFILILIKLVVAVILFALKLK